MDFLYLTTVVAVIIILIVFVFFIIRYIRSKPIGTACANNADCNNGLVCDSTLKVCRASIGSVCTADNQCTSNASCIAGSCKIKSIPITSASTNDPVAPSGLVMPSSPIIVDYTDSECLTDATTSQSSATYSVQLSTIFSSSCPETSFSHHSAEQLADIIEYNNDVMSLLRTGNIFHNNQMWKSNLKLDRLEAMNDKLYGISKGKLFILDKQKQDKLIWVAVSGMPTDIVHTSSTRSGSHLWLQTDQSGYLFNSEGKAVHHQKNIDFIRNYGDSCDYYIDSYPSDDAVIIYAGMEQLSKDVPYAIFDTKMDRIVACTSAEWQKYNDIRLTSRSSYLIERC